MVPFFRCSLFCILSSKCYLPIKFYEKFWNRLSNRIRIIKFCKTIFTFMANIFPIYIVYIVLIIINVLSHLQLSILEIVCKIEAMWFFRHSSFAKRLSDALHLLWVHWISLNKEFSSCNNLAHLLICTNSCIRSSQFKRSRK